jgi:hypothetical protein
MTIASIGAVRDSWFKNAVTYGLNVETYYDRNGDRVC